MMIHGGGPLTSFAVSKKGDDERRLLCAEIQHEDILILKQKLSTCGHAIGTARVLIYTNKVPH